MTPSTRRTTAAMALAAVAGGAAVLIVGRALDSSPAVRDATPTHRAYPYGYAPEPIAEDGSGAVVVAVGRAVYRITFCPPAIPDPAAPSRVIPAPCAMGDGPGATMRPVR